MEIWQSATLAVTSALLCLVLRQYRPEFALVMAILCGVFLLSSVITQLSPVFSGLYELAEQTNVAPTYLQIVINPLAFVIWRSWRRICVGMRDKLRLLQRLNWRDVQLSLFWQCRYSLKS